MLKKKLISMLVFVLSICSFVAAANAAGVEDLTWEVSRKGDITIKSCKADAAGQLVIPSEINGNPVVYIESYAFNSCDQLESVSLPATIKTWPNFSSCDNLKEIIVEEGNPYIASYDGVLYRLFEDISGIDPYASLVFVPAAKIGEIEIPDEINGLPVTIVASSAFRYATGITGISIPASLESGLSFYTGVCNQIEYFEVAQGNTTYSSADGVLFSAEGDVLIRYPAAKDAAEYTIPDGVVEIGAYSFVECDKLESVVFSDTVRIVRERAIYACDHLGTVHLNDGLKELESDAFSSVGLSTLTIPVSVTKLHGHSFGWYSSEREDAPGFYQNQKSETAVIRGYSGTVAEQYAIENDIIFVSMGKYEYDPAEILTYEITSGEVTITGVEIPTIIEMEIPSYIDGYPVVKIGRSAFDSFANLTRVVLPETLTTIDDQAFSFCGALEEVIMPEGLKTVGDMAFAYCGSLYSADLPDTVTDLGDCCFQNCKSLTEFDCPEGITVIPQYCFDGCASLFDVTLCEGLETIGYASFQNCVSLSEIMIPDTVTWIFNYAFKGCDSLMELSIPEGVNSLGGSSLPTHDGFVVYCGANSYAHTFLLNQTSHPYNIVVLFTTFVDDTGTGTWTWAGDHIYACVASGLITGYPDATFLPDKNITRAEYVSILYKTYLALGGSVVDYFHPFEDATDGWYHNALNWAYWTGVVTGTSDTTFSPNATITRQEMATIIYRFMNTFFELEDTVYDDLSGYDDRNAVASWAKEGVQFCVTYGIINGTSDTTLSPTSSATRAQAATIISRTFIE